MTRPVHVSYFSDFPSRHDGCNDFRPSSSATALTCDRYYMTTPSRETLRNSLSMSRLAFANMTEKVEILRVDNVRSDKTLRNGVETYGSQNAIVSYDHKGLNDSNLPDYHDAEVKRIMRKVDWRLPPVLALLYLLSFLDRSNSELNDLGDDQERSV